MTSSLIINPRRLYAVLLSTAILSSPVLLIAQPDLMSIPVSQTQANPPQQQPASSTAMQDSGQNAGEVGQVMADKIFLRQAAEGGLAEVKLSQLAVDKAGSDDVKAFAQKMIDDHIKLNANLAGIADSMGVKLSQSLDKEHQADYDKLSTLSGSDFDTQYLTLMVKAHHKDLHMFRIEAADAADPTLRDAVISAEKTIHDHTVMVDKLARDKGVPIPARPNRPTPPPAS
jgi:putative membrane protein